VPGDRIEQRLRLRAEPPLSEAAVLVRGGPDTRDKLARHAHRTARAWSLDGNPLLGISLFAVPLNDLLSARFATYRMIHLPTAASLRDHGFDTPPDRVHANSFRLVRATHSNPLRSRERRFESCRGHCRGHRVNRDRICRLQSGTRSSACCLACVPVHGCAPDADDVPCARRHMILGRRRRMHSATCRSAGTCEGRDFV
jgi:hypothetical protein